LQAARFIARIRSATDMTVIKEKCEGPNATSPDGEGMGADEAMARVRNAYGHLLERDRVLLEIDANERSLTHKLAEYLQLEFPNWHVDCEYNRDRHEMKRLDWAEVRSDDTNATTVFPDIIVHLRVTNENLIVIEAKKSTTATGGADHRKLARYKEELRYRFAVEVVFPVGVDASDASPAIDVREVVE
jgi:hypothetical protein